MIPTRDTPSELNIVHLVTAMRDRGRSLGGGNFKLSDDASSVGRESYLTGNSHPIYVTNQLDQS